MNMTFNTKDEIKSLLMQSNYAVERALLALYDRQTADEQVSDTTVEKNGQGFAALDASFYTSLAKQVATSTYPTGQRLSRGQFDALRGMRNGKQVRKGIFKYAGQLLEIAREKQAEKEHAATRTREVSAWGPVHAC